MLEKVKQVYVGGGELTFPELVHGELKGMLNTLDPQSEFMEPTKFEELKKDTEGEFGGVGVVIQLSKEKFLTVVAPIADTPAAKAGLQSGDLIAKINNEDTSNMTVDVAVSKIRGAAGTNVTLKLVRSSKPDPFDVTITRADIPLHSVPSSRHNGTVA